MLISTIKQIPQFSKQFLTVHFFNKENKTKQTKRNVASNLYMYKLLSVDITEIKYIKEDNHSVTLNGKRI